MEESLQLQTFIASEMHRQLEKSNVKSCETSVALLCTAIYVAHRFLHFDSTQTWRQSVLYREPFQAWEMWPSPHSEKPVGSEFHRAGLMTTDRFSRGESGLHYTEAALRLGFLLKLPHPELRQQTFTAYL